MKKSLTVNETAEILKVSRRQIYYLVSMSEFDCFKIGAGLRILAESVEDFINRQIFEYENS
ncbi:MAG: helix-turn-helix domain-containing protein [Deltaproteobacteria bacterium]|jgi:excisionase family DNA binding protein|nr:helix-turn-helix domain-containing protein [Deltaproteobacteria bacterium]